MMTILEWVLLYLTASFAMAVLIEMHGRGVPAKKYPLTLVAIALWPIPWVWGFIAGVVEEFGKRLGRGWRSHDDA
jgi:hypothetical protein